MNYEAFLDSKRKSFIESGFEVNKEELNNYLFDFQLYAVQVALRKGRFAALHLNRKSISIELKESYFKINEKNHRDKANEKSTVLTLF
jgi:hypothetical protein